METAAREAYAIADASGRVRATIRDPHAQTDGSNNRVGDGFGNGRLSVTKQLTDESPYRGIVNLVTGGVAEDLAHYLHTSEQIPSAVALGELLSRDGVTHAGGLLVQALPDADDGSWGVWSKGWRPCRLSLSTFVMVERLRVSSTI